MTSCAEPSVIPSKHLRYTYRQIPIDETYSYSYFSGKDRLKRLLLRLLRFF
jgi:hypothetical protein